MKKNKKKKKVLHKIAIPEHRCFLELFLFDKAVETEMAVKLEELTGCNFEGWCTTVAKATTYSWDTNEIVEGFFSSVNAETWALLRRFVEEYGAELVLSIDIWFRTPPALALEKTVISRAAERMIAIDIDLHPMRFYNFSLRSQNHSV